MILPQAWRLGLYALAIGRWVLAQAPSPLDTALALEGKGDEVAALDALAALVQVNPTDPLARIELGRLELKLGKTDSARLDLEKAVEGAPGNPRGHYWLAMAALEQQQVKVAAHELERALALRPDYSDARSELARLSDRIGDPLKSELHYRRLLKERPGLTYARLGLARALEAQKRKAEAEAELVLAAREQPQSLVAARALADFYTRNDRPDLASRVLSAVADSPPPRKMRPLKPSRR